MWVEVWGSVLECGRRCRNESREVWGEWESVMGCGGKSLEVLGRCRGCVEVLGEVCGEAVERFCERC